MTYKARIKFDDKEWLILDNIEYQGVRYFYIIEDISEQLEELDKIEDYKGEFLIEFIYKKENGNYKNVTDRDLKNKLLFIVGRNAFFRKENFE